MKAPCVNAFAVILSEVRRQPNAVEGPHVCGDRRRPWHFLYRAASHV